MEYSEKLVFLKYRPRGRSCPGVLYTGKLGVMIVARFRPPEVVSKTLEQYKRQGERYEIFPCRIEVNGNTYYGASYHLGQPITGYITIKEDGSVPSINLEEVEFATRIYFELINISIALYDFGFRIARKRHLGFMRRTLSILRWVERTMKHEMPPDIQQALEGFIKAPKETIDNHLRLKELVKKTDRHIKQNVKDQVVTPEDHKILGNYHYEFSRCATMQNVVQMKTYEDRKKVIQYLLQRKKFLPAIALWFYHLRMHPDEERVKPKDREMMKEVIDVYINGNMEREEKVFQKALEITRNPREDFASEIK
ncbi:hypothetical protein CLV97_1279 [Planifilum fimeticola]|jgi:hypothetical protein|uniref:Uncharacterized protein n=1 Tax=Planifilum fimeticola TaxID=201975 RepID=A0A2T0LBI8_9BACL|nr:hypothetical protein [Planifilum fimeticola]PRX39227.1 hypothetical protein CLV97_1279 [Planifilum fimeticola]